MSTADKKLNIAIFGGSSQVGSSIALYLKRFTDHNPVCLIRSEYSKFFFDLFGIESHILGDDKEEWKRVMKDADLVIDTTYPAGQTFEIPGNIKRSFERLMQAMPQTAGFIHMSSIMAYGMPSDDKNLKAHSIPRGSYGYIKRTAEAAANSLGKKYGIRVYNFRLSQVHGFLQSVSSSFREKLETNATACVDGHEGDLTNTIFISSLIKAVEQCGWKQVPAGLYTLVSEPQWTLKELYEYYKEYFSLDATMLYAPSSVQKTSLKSKLMQVVKNNRPMLETYVLMRMPELSTKIKGQYRRNEVRAQSAAQRPDYIDFNLLGKPTTATIHNIESDIATVFAREKEMEKYYLETIEGQMK